MKKLVLCLLIVLALSGCAQTVPEPTGTEEPTQQPSEFSQATQPSQPGTTDPTPLQGAELGQTLPEHMQAYRTPSGAFCGLYPFGDGLLLVTVQDTTTLTLLDEEGWIPGTSVDTGCVASTTDSTLTIGSSGLWYYDDQAKEIICYDTQLQRVRSLDMPGDISGMPVLSEDLETVYYAGDGEIRALSSTTGVSRIVKQTGLDGLAVSGMYGEGILRITGFNQEGNLVTAFVSAHDGGTLFTNGGDMTQELPWLTVCGDRYLATVHDGAVKEILFGTLDASDPLALDPQTDWSGAVLLSEDLVLVYGAEEGNCDLAVFRLSDGARTAAVSVPGVEEIWNVTMNAAGSRVYFSSASGGADVFLTWDMAYDAVTDGRVYTGTRYTQDNPDKQGLAECQALAQKMGEQYHVDIRIWEDAAAVQPWDYTLEEEYYVPLYRKSLAALELALKQFPEGFFAQLAESTEEGKIHICLVKDIVGSEQGDTLDHAGGVQFWDGAEAYIALVMGESLEQRFYHELSHVMDARILSHSVLYDDWDELNPEGFTYSYRYEEPETADDLYFHEEKVFVDTYSMTFPKEDRARIMEYAMLDGQQELFDSEYLQRKLQRMCQAIREAFGLTDSSEPLVWEQYLKTPLTEETE